MEAAVTHRTHPLIIVAAVSVTALSLAGIAAIFGVIPDSKSRDTPASSAIQTATLAPVATPAVVASTTRALEASTTLSLPAGTSVRIETPSQPARKSESIARPNKIEAKQPVRDTEPPASTPGYTRVANDAAPTVYAERAPRPVPGVAAPEAAAAVAVAPPCHDCGTIADIREIKQEGEANGIGAVAGGLLGGVAGRQVGGGRGRDAMTVIGAIGGAYAGHRIEKNQRSTNAYEVTVRFDDGSTKLVTQDSVPNWRQGERVRVSGGQISPL